MNHDLPGGSTERNKEVPAGLKAVFDQERHNILGKESFDATPEDVEEFEGLISETSSVEEIQATIDVFNNQFDQAATEFNSSETSEPRRQELQELMVKLLHKIATGNAAVESKKTEPQGRRYSEGEFKKELKILQKDLDQAKNDEDRSQIWDKIKSTKDKRALNIKKLEDKMGVMDPADRQRLSDLDRQNELLEAEYVDLETRHDAGLTGPAYVAEKNRLDNLAYPITQEVIALEQKYQI